MDKERFGTFICELRKEKGMTQQELGHKLYLTNKAISKWERGLSFPDICILQDIAEALGVTVLELLNGERSVGKVIASEDANKIIEDTVNHSGQLIKKLRRKFTTIILLIIGLLPALLMFFSYAGFYVLKEEKSLDDALLTLCVIFVAGFIMFVMYGVPLLGILLIKKFYSTNLMKSNPKIKKIVCVSLGSMFGIWLIFTIIRVAKNIIKYGI